jgi:general secretion pathway protein N
MIDTENNLLTTILAGLIGGLVLIGLALFLLLGRVDLQKVDPVGETGVPRLEVATPEKGLEVFDEYGEIVRRPVFFSDRRLPVVVVAEAEEEPEIEEEIEEEEPTPDLKASVAGIIITPDLRIAMIRDQEANSTMVLSEGMNLEGEQAAWKLDSIESRRVNFVSVDGRNTGLELEVNTRGLTRPTRTRTAAEEAPAEPADEGQTAVPQPDEEALSRAEEIRRRVAERRAELRAEAERRAREQQEQQDNE